MTAEALARLRDVAPVVATPAYVYFADAIVAQCARVRRAFGGRFEVSYAIKANPNLALLSHLSTALTHLDASSLGEVERAVSAGYSASQVSFSGPGKRDFELERALQVGCGEFVCESEWELERLNHLASEAGIRAKALIRLNLAKLPAGFGAHMGGRASQFGIDEEAIDPVVERLAGWPAFDWAGFHVYSGSNCLNPEAIAENMANAFEAFERLSASHGLSPRRLIVGAGFGIPYAADQAPLDLDRVAELVNPLLDRVVSVPRLKGAALVLELGRYLVGPFGYLLTTVTDVKVSRGTAIAICDAGFNNHLAAFGLMGSIIRRNWPIAKVTPSADAGTQLYTLVGPLCTSIDTLATKINLPRLERGDVLAVASSGAYGLTASPTRFISHPEPREFMLGGGAAGGFHVRDISECVPPQLVGKPSEAGSSKRGGR